MSVIRTSDPGAEQPKPPIEVWQPVDQELSNIADACKSQADAWFLFPF